jgi:hypothetical protein
MGTSVRLTGRTGLPRTVGRASSSHWKVLLVVILGSGLSPVAAQTIEQAVTITGIVLDAETGRPLPAALVDVERYEVSAVTGDDGRFQLTLPAGTWTVSAAVVGYGRIRQTVTAQSGETVVEFRLAPGVAPYSERITVRPQAFPDSGATAVSTFRLGGGELLALRGVLADDPMRAVQATPTVTAADDFSAELAVRGQGPRHIAITLDGMDTRLLLHSVRGVADTGSLAIFNSDVLASAALASGAQPQRGVGRLGARLTFDLRDGSRDRFSSRAAVSGTAASVVAEGPIGGNRAASFLLSVRRSYLDWLVRRIDPDVDEAFGFVDGLARVAWQPSSRQTIRFTVLGARSTLTGFESADDGPNSLREGESTTGLANLEWQVSASRRLVTTHRVWLARAAHRNETFDGQPRESGRDLETVYAGHAAWSPRDNVLAEGGVRLGWADAHREAHAFSGGTDTLLLSAQREDASRAAWASVDVRGRPLGFATGARVEWSRMGSIVTASPWVVSEIALTPMTTLRAGVALLHQHPEVQDIPSTNGPLRAERAWNFDVGLERRAGLWRASGTAYYRREANGIREGGQLLVRDQVVRRRPPGLSNRLDGRAWGLEAQVQRRDWVFRVGRLHVRSAPAARRRHG